MGVGEAAKARDYLSGRGLRQVLREFTVGYSPSAWDRVLVGAQRSDYSPPEPVAAAGLAQRGDRGGLYDRFRGRIMFPLADARGRVLGFGARAMRKEDQTPKYLNTSENEIYHKGRQLFGIVQARAHAAKRSDRGGGGLYGRVGAPPGGYPRVRGDHGHSADRRADGEGWDGRPRSWCWRSTPTVPGRRPCCARPGLRRSARSS